MATAQAAKVYEIPPSPHSTGFPGFQLHPSPLPRMASTSHVHMLSPATDSRTYPESKEEVPSTPVPTPELSWFAVHASQAQPRGLLNNLAP